MKTVLKNIHASALSHGTVALCGETDFARYHIWIDPDTLKPYDDVLHKNPPLTTPKLFKHQALSQNAKCNQGIVAELMAASPAAIVVAKINKNREEEVVHEEAAKRQRIHKIKEAGPQLYEVVKALRDWYEESGYNDNGPSGCALLFDDDKTLGTHIREALAAAEA